jgi:hypothetical protein
VTTAMSLSQAGVEAESMSFGSILSCDFFSSPSPSQLYCCPFSLLSVFVKNAVGLLSFLC